MAIADSQSLPMFMLRVLHHMRVDLLRRRFGDDIVATYLSELWVTKLTIHIVSIGGFSKDIESGLLLPISSIESRKQLKMDELFQGTDEDGESNDSLPGFSPFDE